MSLSLSVVWHVRNDIFRNHLPYDCCRNGDNMIGSSGQAALPELLEGGWGWVIVASRFAVNFVISGTIKSMGVLVQHFMWQLDASAGQVGLCVGIFVGLTNLIGPVATAMLRLISHRKLVMLGGFISGIGLALAAMASSVLYLGIGLTITGVGMGFCAVPVISCCTWYFRKKFALINGLSVVGGSAGTMLIPPCTEIVLEKYGWRATIILFAAFSLNLIAAAAAIRRPTTKDVKHIRHNVVDVKHSTITLIKTDVEKIIEKTGRKPKDDLTCMEKDSGIQKIVKSLSKSLYTEIFSVDSTFIVYEVVFLLYAIGYTSWVVFLVPHAIQKGIEPVNAAFLSTMGGFGAILGRLLHGPLIDHGFITGKGLFALLSFVCAWAFLLDPLAQSFYMQIMLAFIVGLSIGSRYPLSVTMVTKLPGLVKPKLMVSAIGWTHFFLGVGKTIGGPLTGWLFDVSGDYNAAFLMMGALELLVTLILCAMILKDRLFVKTRKSVPENV